MKTTGRHLLVEYHGCDRSILNDKARLERLMRLAAEASHATVLGTIFREFSPQGISGVVVVEESHFSIHTWPETGYAAVDCYTCGDCLPEKAHDVLGEGLRAAGSEVMLVERGQHPPRPSVRIAYHRVEEAGRVRPLPVDSRANPLQPLAGAGNGVRAWTGTTKSSKVGSVSD